MASSQEILEGLRRSEARPHQACTNEELHFFVRRLEESLFQRLADRLTIEIGAFRLEVNGRFDALEVRLDRLETEYQMIVVALRRIEETLAEQRTDRAQLRADVAKLKTKVTQLNAKVQELEARLTEE